MISKLNSALVIVGHGSTVNSDSGAPTRAHAEAIGRRGLFAEVVCAFWKEQPALRDALALVKSREIYVVPNFISEGYFTRRIIPREMRLDGPVTNRDGCVIKYCEPAGNHRRMTELLLHRAAAAAPGVDQRETCLVIVGHGTTRDENSAAAVKTQVDKISALKLYGEVTGAFMEQEPLVSGWAELTSLPNVVVVPFFISEGQHSRQDIPVLLGIAAESGGEAPGCGEVFQKDAHHLRGRDLYYSGAIGTDPEFAEVILEQVMAFDEVRLEPQ